MSPDFLVPPPPEEPTRVSAHTKYTTRLWGSNPFEVAVSVTQQIYTAYRPENAPGETNNVGDRPWGIVLVTPDDPLTAISATPLVHFPNDAPILFVKSDGIPQVTLNEIQRLGPTGIARDHNVQILCVGQAANPAVVGQLHALGYKTRSIIAKTIFELANKVDMHYGKVQNPDLGVPTMETSATTGGNGVMDVIIASVDAWMYVLPATHWVSHMPAGLLWVTKDSIPEATRVALQRRMGKGFIYVFGGPDQISSNVMRELTAYGAVTRITADDNMAYNIPPSTTPINVSLAFAKMWDPAGMVGWNITGPGHGFTLCHLDDWPSVIGSCILSHLGFHAPLLLTNDSSKLPPEVKGYFSLVAPTFLPTPAQGPYNMVYALGSYKAITWKLQASIDNQQNMMNRRVTNQNTGSVYISPI